MGRSPVRHGSDAGEEQVLALVREHAGELLRLARRFSICAEDAQDAYQRTLEKLVRRMRHEPPENAVNWVKTVLRHEAMAIRAEREQTIGAFDGDRHRDEDSVDPADRVERFERLAHTAEALRGLKPQEMTALALRAEGLSYKEICARTGWTYTRTNRTINEGRRALLARLSAIESGAECARWFPLLSLLADGEATARELSELRPHLRSCPACRATLRGIHAAPGQVAALLPAAALPALATAGAAGGGLGFGRHLEALAQSFAERANTTVLRFHSVIDTVPGTKLAAVAASTVAVAGGGAAIEQAATAGSGASAAAGAPSVTVASGPSPTASATPIAAPLSATAPTAPGPASPVGPAPAATPSPAAAQPATGPLAEFALEPLAAPPRASSAAFAASSLLPAAAFSAETQPGDPTAPASGRDAPLRDAATPAGSAGGAANARRPGNDTDPATPSPTAGRKQAASGSRDPQGTATSPTAAQTPGEPPEFTSSTAPPPAAPKPAFSQPHQPAVADGAEFATP
ncbi:sigma-70 family RNA polymerase sigma factor [Conexibacter sp. JD483]|uniref:sigma-70 family RNA polymerase sigma factor n=1 Tax=unclassified Conexibacter TaxID=2627773 RepID=UPI0027240546|nr:MULTISPECIES: sigma-70 family RNA polymerase sigma factor [unclassified Conexibacter]MDO8188035.1 sigma-70 family RNA polymerase sigma factor [Conexibacter sp. CPCC 205706]MDO8200457.1 sigma-70 family RNA polymerase sigma factor [Conexibacter sp. CPCC 205762]MDR9369804.1 sigma-70 family RNA polymerase sigma factor [Conexibacter sp. JD483]